MSVMKKVAAAPVQRIQQNLLAASERKLLTWLCARMPSWVTPDLLTAIGLAGAVMTLAGYWASTFDRHWLWLAIAGFVVNWFGDSLDGSLARFRKIERPSFGYFIDHSCDGLAVLLILGGMGASPYVRVDIALFALTAYLLLAVNTFLIAKVMGDFPLSHLGGGPTELRLVLIALTIAMFVAGPDSNVLPGFSGFDLFVGGFSTILLAVFLTQTWRTGRLLAAQDSRRS